MYTTLICTNSHAVHVLVLNTNRHQVRGSAFSLVGIGAQGSH